MPACLPEAVMPRLVEIMPPADPVVLDIAYARTDNLAGRVLYRRPALLLHREAAAALRRAMALAGEAGYRLCLFDGYRPASAQAALFAACPDPAYVTPPEIGSAHSRGVAVDCTLIDPDGVRLAMGTGFDDMSPLAHHARLELGREIQINRALLCGFMCAAGFEPLASEWWHYQLPHARDYPLIEDGDGFEPLGLA